MKNFLKLLLIFSISLTAVACKSKSEQPTLEIQPPNGEEETTYYTATFQVDDETYYVVNVEENGKLIAPTPPKKQQTSTQTFAFDGWWIGEKEWDFERDAITANTVLTAKWEITEEYTQEFLPSKT